ncbi:MAG: phage tail sheath subtilisin-like domain-containing protein [Lachnospiraceae bacterium]|nr:phage tail sheath subtilisin-like domain-containing protein [Lachnospiraceae bacterium]
MAEYLSPGVYVEEYDNAPRAIEGVGTSTAGFVGMAVKGAAKGAPSLITSFAGFIREFGGYLSEFTHGGYRYLAGAVEQFFANGGTRCYVARVAAPGACAASVNKGILHIRAANEGVWGNRIQIHIASAARRKIQLLEKTGENAYRAKNVDGFMEGDKVVFGAAYNRIVSIFDDVITFEVPFTDDPVDTGLVPKKLLYLVETDIQVRYGDEVEDYTGVSFNLASPDYIVHRMKKSELVNVDVELADKLTDPVGQIFEDDKMTGDIVLAGGSDGRIGAVTAGTFIGEDNGPGNRSGIQAFIENDQISMLAVPGITIPDVVVSLVSHCESLKNRFAVLDMPEDYIKTKELLAYREMVDSTYAAMYHPWIQIFDRSMQKSGYFPPSGAVMGVYARTDVTRGVHKAPANETVMCSGLSVNYNKGEQDILNPAGINLIRSLPGQGIRVWGARTAGSNSAFQYVNVRRLFIYVEESIKANTNWVVFEPNDTTLWSRVSITISSFLDTLWRSGMLAGASPEESYFVEIGSSTMTQDDIRNGRLICNIGISPSRPAEFVIFRVTQYTAESGSGN